MDPLTIAALGYLIGALINNAVTGLFKWADTVGLKKESKTLNNELQELHDVLVRARRHTDKSILVLVRDVQLHVNEAAFLLEDFESHKKGTEENVNRSKEPSPEPPACCFRFAAQPKTSPFKSKMSQQMKDLAKKLRKCKIKIQKAMKTISHVGRNKDHDEQVSLLENEASAEDGENYGYDISSPGDVSVGGKRKLGQTSCEAKMAKKSRSTTEMSQDLINLKAENKKLKKDLDESPVKAIKRFLRSHGFKCAAQLACLDQMKFTIYMELQKLGQEYDFVPEKFGYTPISSKLSIPKDLSDYTWDEDKDILYNPNGDKVPSRLQLKNHASTGLVHMCDNDFWPHDLDSFDTPVTGGSPLLDQGYHRAPRARRGLFTKEDMDAQN